MTPSKKEGVCTRTWPPRGMAADHVDSNPSKSGATFINKRSPKTDIYDVVDSRWWDLNYSCINSLLVASANASTCCCFQKQIDGKSQLFFLKCHPLISLPVSLAGKSSRTAPPKRVRRPSSPWRSRWLLWTDFGAFEKVVIGKDSTRDCKIRFHNYVKCHLSAIKPIRRPAKSNNPLESSSIELHFPEGSAQ